MLGATVDGVDDITLTGLRAIGYHGVLAEERRQGQEFVVDVTMQLSTRLAGQTDDVADTVHYGEVAELVVAIVEGDPVNLIETLAARIADDLLDRYPLDAVYITVHKPAAPISVPFADVSVTLRRTKGSS